MLTGVSYGREIRAHDMADTLHERIKATTDIAELKTLLQLRDVEVRRFAALATKLRLPPQSRSDRHLAGAAARHIRGTARPWDGLNEDDDKFFGKNTLPDECLNVLDALPEPALRYGLRDLWVGTIFMMAATERGWDRDELRRCLLWLTVIPCSSHVSVDQFHSGLIWLGVSQRPLEKTEALLPEHREREYPPTVVLTMFLKQALSADRSCQKAVNAWIA
jgi:hypothetical protein